MESNSPEWAAHDGDPKGRRKTAGSGGGTDLDGMPEFDKKTVGVNTSKQDGMMANFERFVQVTDAKLEAAVLAASTACDRWDITPGEAREVITGFGSVVAPSEYDEVYEEYVGLWDKLSKQSSVLNESWEWLRLMKGQVEASQERGYAKSGSFYRGTDLEELGLAIERGGALVGRGARPDISLTMHEEVAIQYGSGIGELNEPSREDGAVIEYDAESVRATGKAKPMAYDYRQMYGHGAGRGQKVLSLRWAHQAEIVVEKNITGTRITGVRMLERAARANPELAIGVVGRGAKLTLVNGWSGSIYGRR